jgi:GAF domain-containing protein
MIKFDAGAPKAARSIMGSLDPRLRDPVGFLMQVWRIGLFVFILYLEFVFDALGGERASIIAWMIGYAAFQLLMEVLLRTSKTFYDTDAFRLARIAAYLALGAWLIAIAPGSRYLLFLFIAIPIFASVVYFKEKRWIQAGVFGLALLGLYLGGIRYAAVPALDWPQYAWQAAILLILWVLMIRLYEVAESSSANLSEMIRILNQTLDLPKLAEHIVSFSQEITGAGRVFVLIIDPEKSRYVYHAGHGFQLVKGRSVEELVEKCQVVRSGTPFRAADAQKELQAGSIYQEFFGVLPRSILVEPIFSREKKILGIITISHDGPNQFTKIEKNRFEQFCYLVGSAVENSLLYRQAKLDESSHRFVSERLSLAPHEDEVVEILVEEAERLIHKADGCVFHSYNPETQELQPKSASYVSAASLGKTVMQPGVGIAGHALELGEPVLVSNLGSHPWYTASGQEVELNSLLVAPLIDPDTFEPIGTLSVHSREPSAFNTEDEADLFSLANQGATALSKIRAFARWRAHGGSIRRILDEFNQMDVQQGERELSEQITQAATAVLGFRIARMRLLDAESGELETVAIHGIPDEEASALIGQQMPWKALEPYLSEKYKAERSYLIPHDLKEWQELCNQYLYVPSAPHTPESGWHEYDAFLTPLITQSGETLGLLSLDLPERDTRPTPEVIEAVGVFASAATLTLELCRLWSRLTEQRSRTVEFIGAIGRQLSSTRDLEAIGKLVVQVGANLLSSEGCSLYLIQGNETVLSYSNYLTNTHYIGRRKPITTQPGCGLTDWVAGTGEELLYNDRSFRQHPAWAGEEDHLPYLPSGECRSLLIVPVQLPGQAPCGVLKLENKKAIAGQAGFSDADRENLILLANNVALAIDWINRYQLIQNWERHGLEDDLHEVVNFYHSGVVLLIDHLTSLLANDELDAARQVLPVIRHRAYTMVDELKAIHTAFRRKYLESERISKGLRLLIEAWIETIGGLGIKLPVSLECAEDLYLPPPVMDTYLRIAASALSNAIKHSGVKENPSGIAIKIQVACAEDRARLVVSDNGRGADMLNEGYGISRMRQLVAKLHSSGYPTELELAAAPGKGVTVAVVSKLHQ